MDKNKRNALVFQKPCFPFHPVLIRCYRPCKLKIHSQCLDARPDILQIF